MANKKISELTVSSSPSTSATLVGVDNGETVQIPISSLPSGGGGGGGGASIIYATELPSTPVQAIYVVTQDEVVKAEWATVDGVLGSDAGCVEVVDTLPESSVGAYDINTDTMYAYYLTTDGGVHSYVDDVLSAEVGGELPVGWIPIATLIELMGMTYGGTITTLDQATDGEALYVILTKQPKTRAYVPKQDGTFLELTSGIRPRFDENSRTVSITEV